MTVRITVRPSRSTRPGGTESESALIDEIHRLGVRSVTGCRVEKLFYLADNPGVEHLARICSRLLVDPVTEEARCDELTTTGGEPDATLDRHAVEVAPRPGVTDVPARELERGLEELGAPATRAATATRYLFAGNPSQAELHRLARSLLCNETIEDYSLGSLLPDFAPEVDADDRVERVSLSGLDRDQLLILSQERMLSLDQEEMSAIQTFFDEAGRAPTDVELETLAQTWSEHCVHKTFRAEIRFCHREADGSLRGEETIHGLLNSYIRRATEIVAPDWLHSAFVDDAGIIAFDEQNDLAFKVETHNHPSALEPFGGANTGIGGVVRDILGVSARPIACTNFLCFGPQDLPVAELPEGLLHPQRIQDGVVRGIGDYGNKLGLPTVNGAVIYDDGYLGNPLVFCGAAGLLPRGKHPTRPRMGDRVVVVGGRTGRDGLHGATFSSAELTHETSTRAGSAVQIGDPITEKGLIEFVEAARDRSLYTAITDCGAGGLSSSIGEMGEELGVDVSLEDVPLKYPGLTPWEIWLSEAQERMVLAVPPEHLATVQILADHWGLELRDLGRFSGDGVLRVRYRQTVVAELPMAFLHDGLPTRRMQAEYREPTAPNTGGATRDDDAVDLPATLLAMLAHPSVASKEEIVRTYDHEVRGGTLVRPFTGPQMDGPTDAAVLKPLGTWTHDRAFSLSAGINPLLGRRDPYAMAVSAIDEAVRNAVAVGADPDRIALLDNFCWGNPTLPDRLGSLVRACQGCHDAAVAFRAPFISGKDSLYNEFNGTPIPGTLLISAMGIVPDMKRTCTSDLKAAGNRLYLLGETEDELGGSLLHHLRGWTGGKSPELPVEPLARYRALHRAIRSGLVAACHDLSEGGLAVSLAEMCIAGRLGAEITLPASSLSPATQLFSESNGRLLLEIAPTDVAAVETAFAGLPLMALGTVTEAPRLLARGPGASADTLLDLPLADLVRAWTHAA